MGRNHSGPEYNPMPPAHHHGYNPPYLSCFPVTGSKGSGNYYVPHLVIILVDHNSLFQQHDAVAGIKFNERIVFPGRNAAVPGIIIRESQYRIGEPFVGKIRTMLPIRQGRHNGALFRFMDVPHWRPGC
jgi:hypothetical protein